MDSKKYLPYIFYGVANPRGEHFLADTTYLDAYQIATFVEDSYKFRLPVYIEHNVYKKNTGQKLPSSGHTIGAKVDEETKGIGIFFVLYDDKFGEIAFSCMTVGIGTEKKKLQQLSLGYNIQEDQKTRTAIGHKITEVSIVANGARKQTHIKGYIALTDNQSNSYSEVRF